MMRMNRSIGIIFFVIWMFFESTGQSFSSVKLYSDTVFIGDPVKIDIKLTIPDDIDFEGLDLSPFTQIKNQLYAQDTVNFEGLADIEILDFGDWKHEGISTPIPPDKVKTVQQNGQKSISNTITIAIYNSGSFYIPAPVPLFKNKDVQHTHGQAPALYVSLPQRMMQKDTVIFNPIKDIIREQADISDYLIYVYILTGLLLMAGIGYYFYKQKNQKTIVPTIIHEKPVPCHEKALTALKNLEKQELWQQGFIKEYQTGLTDIIRSYIMDRYKIDAPEMTTDEVISALSHSGFDKRYNQDLTTILQIADLVKFAKARPDENIHDAFMKKAVEFVENTKETSQTTPA